MEISYRPLSLIHIFQELTVRPISIEVRNESVDGIKIKELRPLLNRKFVISRIKHREGGETELVNSETTLHAVSYTHLQQPDRSFHTLLILKAHKKREYIPVAVPDEIL